MLMKEIIFTYIMNYAIVVISSCCFVFLGWGSVDFFLQNIAIYLTVFFNLFITIYLYLKNRKVDKILNFKKCFSLISFGISLAIFLNMIIFLFQKSEVNTSIPIFIAFLASGIVGPVYEEILFRYIFLSRLRLKYSLKKSILICSGVFAILHFSPVYIIYAFIMGIFFAIIYIKEDSIFAPILVHISANSVVLLLCCFDFKIFLLSIINLLISSYLVFN